MLENKISKSATIEYPHYVNPRSGRINSWVYKTIVVKKTRTKRVEFPMKDMTKPVKSIIKVDGNKLGTRKREMYSKLMEDTVRDSLEKIHQYQKGEIPYEEVFLTDRELNDIFNKAKKGK